MLKAQYYPPIISILYWGLLDSRMSGKFFLCITSLTLQSAFEVVRVILLPEGWLSKSHSKLGFEITSVWLLTPSYWAVHQPGSPDSITELTRPMAIGLPKYLSLVSCHSSSHTYTELSMVSYTHTQSFFSCSISLKYHSPLSADSLFFFF